MPNADESIDAATDQSWNGQEFFSSIGAEVVAKRGRNPRISFNVFAGQRHFRKKHLLQSFILFPGGRIGNKWMPGLDRRKIRTVHPRTQNY